MTQQAAPGSSILVLPAREVPLGGLRAMNVQRALPQRALPTVGAWCFLDRFGPQRATMRVDPHPHTGLQTVTWPLAGEVRHRDALGNDVVLRPGALNLMTSGWGISHSEYSLGESPVDLDALQLWIALPSATRDGEPGFESHGDLPTFSLPSSIGAAAEAVVVMGTLAGVTSPATTHTPLVGAQIRVPAGARVGIPLESHWEHALIVLEGELAIHASAAPEGEAVRPGRNDLAYLGSGRDRVEVASSTGAVIFLIGGEPFEDELVMWWNFVGRHHEEIVQAREDWESGSSRFGRVAGHEGARVPAPPMPRVRLSPRRHHR